MTYVSSLNRLLGQLGQLDGIPDFRLSPEGTATLRYNREQPVYFEFREATSTLFIYTPLLVLGHDSERRSRMMHAMLCANFLRLETWHGEIAVEPEMEQAVYQIALDAGLLTVARLDQQIDALLTQADAWRRRLESIAAQSRVPGRPRQTGSILRHITDQRR